jgi:hypothetical protein
MARKVMTLVVAVLVVLLFTHDGFAHDPGLASARPGDDQVQVDGVDVPPFRAENAHSPGQPHRHGLSLVTASHRVDSPDRILIRVPEDAQPSRLRAERPVPARGAAGTPDIIVLQTFRC